MRYERSQSANLEKTTRFSIRTRLLITSTVVIAVALTVYFISAGSNNYARITGTAAQVSATEATFLEANILIENLGAPTPPNFDARTWLLRSHPISRDQKGVIAPSYPWIGRTGKFQPLTYPKSRSEFAEQSAVVASIFDDGARADTVAELRQVIAEESGGHPRIAAAGGASIVKWLHVQIVGTTANLEADVNVWVATPTLQSLGGRSSLVPSLNSNQLDVQAMLVKVGSHWFVTKFTQAPWQEAT